VQRRPTTVVFNLKVTVMCINTIAIQQQKINCDDMRVDGHVIVHDCRILGYVYSVVDPCWFPTGTPCVYMFSDMLGTLITSIAYFASTSRTTVLASLEPLIDASLVESVFTFQKTQIIFRIIFIQTYWTL
jgi:hypothetical protein